MKQLLLLLTLSLGLIALPAHANLLTDGDFSDISDLGTGNPDGTGLRNDFVPLPSAGNPNQWAYDANAAVSTYNIGVPAGSVGGWTFINTGGISGSAIYLIDTDLPYPNQNWVPQAAATNTNGYVVQLDSISVAGPWTVGNAVQQTVNLTAGTYALTFSINTESTSPKAGTSYGDVMITGGTVINPGGGLLISNTPGTNINPSTYGTGTGYQYSVTTTGNGGNAGTWATYTLDFTVSSTSNVQIDLADDPGALGNDSNSNISLENISLLAIVPEPREWSMMVLLAMVGLMAVRKFKSRSSEAPVFASID